MKKTFVRLLAVVMCVVMMLTAAPLGGFVASAEETTKDTIVFGSLVWDVVKEEADGDLVLITKDVIAKAKFNTKAPMNFATSTLYTTLNTDFYANFSEAEKAAITPTTITYDYWDATAKAKVTGATLSANVVLPDAEMAKSLGVAYLAGTETATTYFLASARANTATDAVITAISKTGTVSNSSGASATMAGYRAVITLKAGNFAKFPAVDGVSFTVNDNAVTYYATTSATSFMVAVDTENYISDNIMVTLGDEILSATDGVYTIPAGSTEAVAVTGLTAQPADFTAYNEALVQAGEVDREFYDTTDLDAAIAVDVSACTKLEQAKVDEATAAILDAIANLKYKPADTVAYLEAVKETRRILANEPIEITPTLTASIYNLYAQANEIGDNFRNAMTNALNAYEDRTNTPISGYTIDKQAEVDAATAALEDLNARVPLMRADISAWRSAINNVRNINPSLCSNAAELNAMVDAIIAENNYEELALDITHQAEIDASTQTILAIYEQREEISLDEIFANLEAAVTRAATYKSNQTVYCNTSGWDAFITNLNNANSYLADKEAYSDTVYRGDINYVAEQLAAAMDEMDICVALATDSSADEAVIDKVIWYYNTETDNLYFGGTGVVDFFVTTYYDAKNITIGKNITDVMFLDECYNLTSIKVYEGNTHLSSDENGVLFNADKTTLIQYPVGNTRTSYTIPDSVTTIEDEAFRDCDSLTSVTIGNSVTTIGRYAFYDCYSLTSVTIPDSVTTIGDWAFSFCYSLTSVTIPDSVTTIGEGAFEGCGSLTSVTIGPGVKSFGYEAFYGCRSLKNVYYTGDVAGWCSISFESYDSTPLYYADNLYLGGELVTDLVIPDSVTSIGNYAFAGYSKLKTVTVGIAVTSIGYSSFSGCSSIESVTYNGAAEQWNSIEVQSGNSDLLTALVFGTDTDRPYFAPGKCGENLEWILYTDGELVITGTGAMNDWWYSDEVPWYDYNDYIRSVTIADSVTTIGDYAFYDCDSLTNVTISDSVTRIGEYAFQYCDSLTSVTIPDSVTTIGDGAFCDCESLTSVTIPDSVTTIGRYSFYGCDSLTSVTIPDSVTTIGDYTFADCTSLTSVTIPDSVTTIGNSAFEGCDSLTSVTIPDSVTTIGGSAFSGCKSLTNITIPDGVTTIGGFAFSDCDSLTSVIIPDSVTNIGDYAFAYCDSLTSVTIPDSVTSIGNSAFNDCDSLTSITVDENNQYYSSDENGVLFNNDKTELIQYPVGNTRTSYKIPDSVTTIGRYAFAYCTSLTNVTIPDSVTTIGYYAFAYCNSLTNVTIGNSVTRIGDYAFAYCTSLASVTIPDSVEYIGYGAFSNCTSLTGIVIPDKVQYIHYETFYYCKNLKNITIGKNVEHINYNAFSGCNNIKSVTLHPENENFYLDSNGFLYDMNGDIVIVIQNSMVITLPVGVINRYDYYDDFWNNFTNASELIFEADKVTIIRSGSDTTKITIAEDFTDFETVAKLKHSMQKISSITVAKGNTEFVVVDGVLYDSAVETLLLYPTASSDKSYVMPDSVVRFGGMLFKENTSLALTQLESITLGKSFGQEDADLGGVIKEMLDELSYPEFFISYLISLAGETSFSVYEMYENNLLPVSLEQVFVAEGNPAYYSDENGSLWLNLKADLGKDMLMFFSKTLNDTVVELNGDYWYDFFAFTGNRNIDFVITEEYSQIIKEFFDFCTDLGAIEEGYGIFMASLSSMRAKSFTVSPDDPLFAVKNGALFSKDKSELFKFPLDSDITLFFWNEDVTFPLYDMDFPVFPFASFSFADAESVNKLTLTGADNLTIHIDDSVGLDETLYYTIGAGTVCATNEDLVDALNNLFDEMREDGLDITSKAKLCAGYHEHEHDYSSVVVPPTCTNDGYTAHTCDICGDVLYTDIVPAFGHTPGEWQVIIGADGEGSKKIKQCMVCNAVIEEIALIAGELGENLIWAFDENTGAFEFFGAGAIPGYSRGKVPWYELLPLIRSIDINEGITAIGKNTFYGCWDLETVVIKGYDVAIANGVFDDCDSADIHCLFGSSAHDYAKINNIAYTLLDGISVGFTVKNGTVTAYSGTSANPVIPSGVTSIGSYAFKNNTTITSIVLPFSVTEIYTGAFANCANLERIIIPESVGTIASTAFSGTDVIFACVENSYAHLYAVEHGIEFELTSRENGVSLTSRNEYITVNGKTQLSAVVTSGSKSVIWSSSDSTVASVDSNGLVTGKKAGSVVITAATADGYKDFCLVRVVGITGSYNKGTVIDPESSCIYGLDVGLQSISDYVELVDESCTLEYDTLTDEIGTGTITNVVRDGEIVDSYTVIIFGDIDGNGWYDANDAFIVNMIANGLISADRLSAAQFRAADCNHDGAVDDADFYLLNQASLMLDDIDQSATKEQLATNAMYISYCSLIDQTAGEETNLIPVPDNDEAPSDTTADAAPSEPAEANDFEAIFTMIIDFFKKIFTFVFFFVIK